MKYRKERQEKMRLIIRNGRVRTQHELVEALAREGFHCTQATVSRDVDELHLTKQADGYYVLAEDQHLQRMVHDLTSSIQRTGNLILIHAQPGTAPGVAGAIDRADIPTILGTVSGDTTVLIVADTDDSAIAFEQKLLRYKGRAGK